MVDRPTNADQPAHTSPHPDVAGYLLGSLTPAEAGAFAEHLVGCEVCRIELQRLAGVVDLLVDVPPEVALPDGLHARTFAAIEAAAVAGAPEGRGMASGDVVALGDRPRRRQGNRRLLAAAAAIITVAIGVGVLTDIGRSPRAATARVRLIASNHGPAHGTATIAASPNGLVIDMTIDDPPLSPPGTFYTCWLIGAGDSLAHPDRVSVGSFVVRSHHPVHVHWTTAADLRRFSHLGVTLEPDNGNPSHQGPRVLSGAGAVPAPGPA